LRRGVVGALGNEHLVIEGAAAAGLAALSSGQLDVKGQRVVAILTGANTAAATAAATMTPRNSTAAGDLSGRSSSGRIDEESPRGSAGRGSIRSSTRR